jgi:hypothetical protein
MGAGRLTSALGRVRALHLVRTLQPRCRYIYTCLRRVWRLRFFGSADDHDDRFIYCIIMLGGPCMMITNDKTLGCINPAVNEGLPAPPFRNSTITSVCTICFPSLVSGVTHHNERRARSFIRLRFHSSIAFRLDFTVSQHIGIELAFGLNALGCGSRGPTTQLTRLMPDNRINNNCRNPLALGSGHTPTQLRGEHPIVRRVEQ